MSLSSALAIAVASGLQGCTRTESKARVSAPRPARIKIEIAGSKNQGLGLADVSPTFVGLSVAGSGSEPLRQTLQLGENFLEVLPGEREFRAAVVSYRSDDTAPVFYYSIARAVVNVNQDTDTVELKFGNYSTVPARNVYGLVYENEQTPASDAEITAIEPFTGVPLALEGQSSATGSLARSNGQGAFGFRFLSQLPNVADVVQILVRKNGAEKKFSFPISDSTRPGVTLPFMNLDGQDKAVVPQFSNPDDFDLDGTPNYMEFASGTNPFSELSGARGDKGDKGDKGDTGIAGTNGNNGTATAFKVYFGIPSATTLIGDFLSYFGQGSVFAKSANFLGLGEGFFAVGQDSETFQSRIMETDFQGYSSADCSGAEFYVPQQGAVLGYPFFYSNNAEAAPQIMRVAGNAPPAPSLMGSYKKSHDSNGACENWHNVNDYRGPYMNGLFSRGREYSNGSADVSVGITVAKVGAGSVDTVFAAAARGDAFSDMGESKLTIKQCVLAKGCFNLNDWQQTEVSVPPGSPGPRLRAIVGDPFIVNNTFYAALYYADNMSKKSVKLLSCALNANGIPCAAGTSPVLTETGASVPTDFTIVDMHASIVGDANTIVVATWMKSIFTSTANYTSSMQKCFIPSTVLTCSDLGQPLTLMPEVKPRFTLIKHPDGTTYVVLAGRKNSPVDHATFASCKLIADASGNSCRNGFTVSPNLVTSNSTTAPLNPISNVVATPWIVDASNVRLSLAYLSRLNPGTAPTLGDSVAIPLAQISCLFDFTTGLCAAGASPSVVTSSAFPGGNVNWNFSNNPNMLSLVKTLDFARAPELVALPYGYDQMPAAVVKKLVMNVSTGAFYDSGANVSDLSNVPLESGILGAKIGYISTQEHSGTAASPTYLTFDWNTMPYARNVKMWALPAVNTGVAVPTWSGHLQIK